MHPLKHWTKRFRKHIKYDTNDVQLRFRLLESGWIKYNEEEIPGKEIKEAVRHYKLIDFEGVGFVMFVKEFNKNTEKVKVQYVFFDISNRNVIWSVELESYAGGLGMTNHWAYGLAQNLDKFWIAYRKKFKELKKRIED
jgi:hypothetical protein